MVKIFDTVHDKQSQYVLSSKLRISELYVSQLQQIRSLFRGLDLF